MQLWTGTLSAGPFFIRLREHRHQPEVQRTEPATLPHRIGQSSRSPGAELLACGLSIAGVLSDTLKAAGPAGAVPTAPGVSLPHISTAPSPHSPSTALRRKVSKSTDVTTAHVENPNVRALQPSNDELHRRQTPRTSRCLCWPFSSQMVWKSCAKTGRTRCNAVAHKELRLPSHPVFQLNRVNVLFRQQSQLPNNLLE